MIIGSHVSFKSPNYLIGSIKESIKNGANAMMIYLGPNQSTKRSDPLKWKINEYKNEFVKFFDYTKIIVHAPYIVNLCNFEKADFGINFIIQEIERMNYIGLKYLVLHPGSSLKQDREETIVFLANNLKKIINRTNNVEILLETMSGKGSEIGKNLFELKKIIELINSERVGICLDTCHLWDSGYDLKTDFVENDGKNLINQLKDMNLAEKIKLIHLNDSKNEMGSCKDRHENIGKGKIGLKALKNICSHPFFKTIPKILETPYIHENIYKNEIKLLKE